MFSVRKMLVEDFPFAVQITERVGWGLEKADFEFMMELEPEGCFVLFEDSERIGLVTNVGYGSMAWFGNLIVDKEHRKKGAGSLLVKHSIDYLARKKVRTIGLYAYMERIPFYESLGFVYDLDFVVLKGKGFSSKVGANVRKAGREDVKKIMDFDCGCFGASRKKLLEPVILDPDNLRYIAAENGKISGFAVAKVYGGMAELGPLECRQECSDVTIDLLKATLDRLKGVEVSLFVPDKESAVLSTLAGHGFKESFRVARMFHGPSVKGGCVYLAESLERG
jgi:GNAT superfamily N-acetyltransferase